MNRVTDLLCNKLSGKLDLSKIAALAGQIAQAGHSLYSEDLRLMLFVRRGVDYLLRL